jgi:hypothetical protein
MKQKRKTTSQTKQIVYLIGSGATQAEADYRGGEKVDLLMKGLSQRILQRANTDRTLKLQEPDIEKLISLLTATGIADYIKEAAVLREAYYEEILENLSKAGILQKPDLAIGLFEMHNNVLFKQFERLSGVISLNHDNLFQVASRKVHGCINLGFNFEQTYFKWGRPEKVPRVIQLHGSFNWLNALPIKVVELASQNRYDQDMLWIPPSILKELKDYPYNKLTGLAYELLLKRCDILRIIGCSLSQNDWNIISLLFNAQYKQFFHNKLCFKIQLIMPPEAGEEVAKEMSYFKNLFPIQYLTDGNFADYKKDKSDRSSEMSNPFKYWIKAKVNYHINKKELDLKTIGKTLKKIIGA